MSETLVGGELRIHLLGQPRFSWRGEAYPFHSRPRSLALVAFLLLHRGAHITRDALAFTLWPEDTEEEARGKLRRHLYQANSALPPSKVPYIVAKGDVIGWNDEAQTWCDVDEFERCCADEAHWPDAMGLYDGDLVPAIYDDWIFPIRERLRREFISTMERLLIRARNQRDFGRAIAYAARILNYDPWREDVLRQLASVRYESGDRAGAIREIDAFAQRLMDEMSVEAMPETTAQRTLMLHGKALPDGGVPSIPPEAASRVPFVGRSSELDRLAGAWRRAACGRGEVLFVSGEAGIGKTRLLGELALTATLEGGRVFRGTTSSPEETPYQSIVEALREALPFLEAADIRPIWLSALSVLLPELSLRQSDLTALPVLDAAREHSRLLEASASTLHGLSRQRPLLLVLDDIQWAGEATLAAIEYLARRTAAMPALIVATYRSDHDEARAVGHLRRKLQRENLIGHMSLGGLSTDSVCELARSLPELADRADATGVEVHEITAGNPLFAIELLRERAEGGDVSSPTLSAMIAARTARMGEPARKVAEIASVAGASVDVDLLREVSGLPEDVVLDAVSELLERRLLREVGRVRFAFVFGHQLIASAIYEEVEEQRRMQLHRRTALAIEKLFGERDEFAAPLAYHYDRAAESGRAAHWYLRCAEHAFALFANEEALASAARGFELTQDPSLQSTLLGLRERVLGRLGNREAQRTTIDQLERLAIGEDARADILWRNACLAHAQRDLSAEAECLQAYCAYALARGDRARNAAAESAVARNLLLRSRYEEAAQAAESAVEAYRALEDAAGEVESLCLLAEITVNRGELNRVDSALAAAHERAERGGDRPLMARVAMADVAIAIMRRRFFDGLERAKLAQALFREVGDREGEAEAGTRVGSALAFLGRFEEARAEFDDAANIYRELGCRSQLAYLAFNQTGNQMQLGLLADARSSLTGAIEIFEALDDPRGRAACLTNLSMVRLLQGDVDEAEALGSQALQWAREIGNKIIEAGALSNLGNAERELGKLEAALGHMREAIAIRKQLGRSATFEELADLALAQLKAGDAAAVTTADDIVARADRSGENTVWPHYCFLAAARVYHWKGDAAKAARAMRRAEELVRAQLGAIADEQLRAAFEALASVRAVRAGLSGDGALLRSS